MKDSKTPQWLGIGADTPYECYVHSYVMATHHGVVMLTMNNVGLSQLFIPGATLEDFGLVGNSPPEPPLDWEVKLCKSLSGLPDVLEVDYARKGDFVVISARVRVSVSGRIPIEKKLPSGFAVVEYIEEPTGFLDGAAWQIFKIEGSG